MRVPASVPVVALVIVLCAPALVQETKSASPEEGQLVFNNACRTCHSIKEGDNRLGPHLHGIIGRKAGSVANFAYSDSMKQSGVTWDEATLDRFIANPDEVVHGNKMKPFGGMASAEERAKLLAYLKAAS